MYLLKYALFEVVIMQGCVYYSLL